MILPLNIMNGGELTFRGWCTSFANICSVLTGLWCITVIQGENRCSFVFAAPAMTSIMSTFISALRERGNVACDAAFGSFGPVSWSVHAMFFLSVSYDPARHAMISRHRAFKPPRNRLFTAPQIIEICKCLKVTVVVCLVSCCFLYIFCLSDLLFTW